jgi:hypothetical protein
MQKKRKGKSEWNGIKQRDMKAVTVQCPLHPAMIKVSNF